MLKLHRKELNKQEILARKESNQIWTKTLTLEEIIILLDEIKKETSLYKFKFDKHFIMNSRRQTLKKIIYERLDDQNENNLKDIQESLFNLWEFIRDEYDGDIKQTSKIFKVPGKNIIKRCNKYRKKSIMCLQEKNIILEIITKIEKSSLKIKNKI